MFVALRIEIRLFQGRSARCVLRRDAPDAIEFVAFSDSLAFRILKFYKNPF